MMEPSTLAIPWGAILIAGLALLSSVALLYLFGHRTERQVRRDWELLLTPKGGPLYRNNEGRAYGNRGLLARIKEGEALPGHKRLLCPSCEAPSLRVVAEPTPGAEAGSHRLVYVHEDGRRCAS
jgi:hypothetical protein